MAKRKSTQPEQIRRDSPDRETSPIARFVRERRRANGLSQREFAELAGIGPRAVWDLERGKPTLRRDVVNAALRVFGKTLGIVDAARTDFELKEGDR